MPNVAPQAWPKERQPAPPTYRIGLALSGGSARGIAHLGVLEVLEREEIRPAYVAGVSAGAVVGALYCAGYSVAQLQAMASELKWSRLIQPCWPRLSLFRTARLEERLNELLGGKTFEQLPLPLAVVAVDIATSEALTLHAGNVARAVCASCAMPGILSPVEWDGRLLVDGGVLNDVPVTPLREMGADYVIASALAKPRRSRPRPRSIFRMWSSMLDTVARLTEREAFLADCMIQPDVERFSLTDFGHSDELLASGRQAAEARLPQLRAGLGILWSPNDDA